MHSLRHLVPSAGALIVFEAAGRLLGFTAAGRELGMSQAAVSYAIRGLEKQLGVTLFRREHRRVTLTDAGERFFADVTLGLSHIRKSAEELRSFAADPHVTLSGSTAFTSLWMMPRLQQFRDEVPGINLRIHTSDRDLDIISEGFPLAIRGGSPEHWPDYDAMLLAEEEIHAVAGLSYARSHALPRTVEELAAHRLIHLEERYREAADWKDWFASAGVEPDMGTRGLLINDYVLVIVAVMVGQGIALGWRHLTERLIDAGLLVRVTDHSLSTGKGVYVVWPKARELTDSMKRVRDWLIDRS